MDPQCVPKFLVFDESHMLKGALGINISYILSRFRRVLNHYHYQKFGHPYKPILIGSTATIKAPEEFASCLFNIDKSKVDLKPPDVSLTHEDYPYVNEKDEETIRRFHVLLMPSAYFAQDTVTNIVLELLTFFACEGEKVGLKDLKPQVLGFVNSIREANDLISRTRHRITRDFPNISVDGHNTDFDKVQRAEVEKKFNERGVNILYATRTLEVGVDFDDIDTLLVFGAPFSYNDYLQRIGRAGRKRDALIVTVLRNFIPIDNYYFEHSKELIDQDLHKYNIERVPILRDNPHIKKKSVIASAFGYMAVHEDADKFQEDVKRFDRLFYSERGDWLQSKEYSKFVDWVFESLEGSLSRSECEDILKHEFLRKLHDICEKESFRSKLSLAEILEDFNKFYFLFSIRMCDPEVGVSFE